MRWIAWPMLLLLGASGAIAATDRVKLELHAPEGNAVRGRRMALDVSAIIESGWHINGHEPIQPYLIPTELRFTLPPGVATDTIRYPSADKRTFAFAPGEQLLVYEGTVAVTTALLVPDGFPGSRIRIEAELHYQACNDSTCLPPSAATAELIVPVVDAPAGSTRSDDEERSVGGGTALPGWHIEGWLRERGLAFLLLGTALLWLFFAFFVQRTDVSSSRWVKHAAALAFVVLAFVLVHEAAGGKVIAWEAAALDSGGERHPGGKPLLIDFVAAWCIPCGEMERTTYADAGVIEEAKRFRMVKADVTQEDDATTRTVEGYQVRGVPTVILYGHDGRERQRFVGYTGPDELLAAMKQVD